MTFVMQTRIASAYTLKFRVCSIVAVGRNGKLLIKPNVSLPVRIAPYRIVATPPFFFFLRYSFFFLSYYEGELRQRN